ncbi:Drimenol monooxygenase-like protein, partial [Drosera capensis]
MATAHTTVYASYLSPNHPMFRSTLTPIASSPPLRVAAAASFRFSPASIPRTPAPSPIRVISRSCNFSCKPFGVFLKTRSNVSCAAHMADGQAGDSGKFDLDHIKAKVKNFWDQLPEPVKAFPWIQVLENFLQLVLDLSLTVIKYLSIPLLAVTSISELIYCAHERKLDLVPIPLICGIVVGGIMIATAKKLSPPPKDAVVPWHLITLAMVFVLLKLPGPYYPFWGRIFIPQLANGGLWRIFWSLHLWNRGHINRRISSVEECCQAGTAINIGQAVFNTNLNSMSWLFFSKDLADANTESGREFKKLIRAMFEIGGEPNLVDFFPQFSLLRMIDAQGIRGRAEINNKK